MKDNFEELDDLVSIPLPNGQNGGIFCELNDLKPETGGLFDRTSEVVALQNLERPTRLMFQYWLMESVK